MSTPWHHSKASLLYRLWRWLTGTMCNKFHWLSKQLHWQVLATGSFYVHHQDQDLARFRRHIIYHHHLVICHLFTWCCVPFRSNCFSLEMVSCIARPLSARPVYFFSESLTTVHDWFILLWITIVYLCFVLFIIVVLVCTDHFFVLCKSQRIFSITSSSVDRWTDNPLCVTVKIFTANFPPKW